MLHLVKNLTTSSDQPISFRLITDQIILYFWNRWC